MVAWSRIRATKGARSAGVDGQTARSIEAGRGVDAFLTDVREELRQRSFAPLPVRERMIPKAAGKCRRLGIPAARDRVVQAALLLVLEPILEADFQPCSYGFRPNRRAHDAIAEVHMFARNGYTWVFEGDIEACFDNIDHTALMGRLRRRVGDKRVLALVKAFLKAGILGEDQVDRETRPARPRAGSCLRCWPTWRCQTSTIISPSSGSRPAPPGSIGPAVTVTDWRPIAWCDTPTTS